MNRQSRTCTFLLVMGLFGCEEVKTQPANINATKAEDVPNHVYVKPFNMLDTVKEEQVPKSFSCSSGSSLPQLTVVCNILNSLSTIKHATTDEKTLYEDHKHVWKKYKTFYRGIETPLGNCDLIYSTVDKSIVNLMCFFNEDLEEKYITDVFLKKIHPDPKYSFIRGYIVLDNIKIEVYTSIGYKDSRLFYKSPSYELLERKDPNN